MNNHGKDSGGGCGKESGGGGGKERDKESSHGQEQPCEEQPYRRPMRDMGGGLIVYEDSDIYAEIVAWRLHIFPLGGDRTEDVYGKRIYEFQPSSIASGLLPHRS